MDLYEMFEAEKRKPDVAIKNTGISFADVGRQLKRFNLAMMCFNSVVIDPKAAVKIVSSA